MLKLSEAALLRPFFANGHRSLGDIRALRKDQKPHRIAFGRVRELADATLELRSVRLPTPAEKDPVEKCHAGTEDGDFSNGIFEDDDEAFVAAAGVGGPPEGKPVGVQLTLNHQYTIHKRWSVVDLHT